MDQINEQTDIKVQIDDNPHAQFIRDLKKPDSLTNYSTNSGQLGGVINAYVTEINPPNPLLNKIQTENLVSVDGESLLPIVERSDKPDNLVVEVKGRRVPVVLNIDKIGDKQVTRLALNLRQVCSGFGNKDFRLEELPINILTLEDAANHFKRIDEKAVEASMPDWKADFTDSVDGPVLERQTDHGQTWKSFAESLDKATEGKLKLRTETGKEKLKRIALNQYE